MLKVFYFVALCLACFASLGKVNLENIEFSTLANVGREITTECSDFLRLFANTTKRYNLCAVKHAKPLRFCEMCTSEYTHLLENDPVKYGKCVKDLVKSERFQIVMKVYDFQTGLWQSANCNSCFKPCSDISNCTWEQTNHTKKFFRRFAAVLNCFKNYSDGPVTNTSLLCNSCQHDFDKLRRVYKKILDKVKNMDEDGLCVDIMSAMNNTRNDWKSYGCFEDKRKNFFVLSLSGLLCFLAFIFYVGVRKHEKYKHKVQSRSHQIKKEVNYDSE